MPRYLTSVARMIPGPELSDIVLGGQRMIQALEYVHSKGLVHMDVKVSLQYSLPINFCPSPEVFNACHCQMTVTLICPICRVYLFISGRQLHGRPQR